MKPFAALVVCLVVCLAVIPSASRAAELNLATLTCAKYENEVLPAAASSTSADSLDTVMWLFGFSVAKSGAHVMYSDALAPFGFALDNECKSNPAETMLDALSIVKPESKNPMNLAGVECSSFASRHMEFARSDADSAKTIMMWLFGFSTARSGSRLFDPDSLHAFETALLADCAKHPSASLFDALTRVKIPRQAR
ncbi:MAG TPA: HdeA/HdeB family chaperone [Steroidobacteraceae bacterium]|jgi:hypothetical protein|nr:HdeA/HdeB family chaperone [Steroidobacteraceae bacterium]